MKNLDEFKFLRMIDQVPGYIAYVNAETLHYEFVNKAFESAFGLPRDKIIGSHIRDVIGEKNFQFAMKYITELRAGKTVSYENTFDLATGKRWIQVNYSPLFDDDGRVNTIVVMSYDITERKNADNLLFESNNRLQLVLDNTPIAIWDWNLKTDVWFVTPKYYTMLGYEPESGSADRTVWLSRAHPDDREAVRLKIEKVLFNQEEQYSYDARILHADGSYRWQTVLGQVIERDENGKAARMIGVRIDVHERKQAEAERALSEARLVDAQAVAKVGSWETDLSNLNVKWSEETFRIFELDPNSFKATHPAFLEFIHPDDRARVGAAFVSSIEKNSYNSIEHRIVTSSGAVKFVEERWRIDHDSQGRPVRAVGTCQDISERRQIEEELHKAQKLESLGVLAGGIAHDFNNLMSGIYPFIELAGKESRDKNVTAYLSKAMTTIDRARALTKQLLTFSRGGAPIRKAGKLFPFVHDTVKFALSGSNISCSFDIPQGLWMCSFDINQIGQVIDNLIINARQAMPEGGTVQVSAENVSFNEKAHHYLGSGAYVRISIKDSGEGIPAEILPSVFDPFFTTKEKGHGLGLATCFSIVKRHGGCIDIDSLPGQGCTFHVYLPASLEMEAPEKVKSPVVHKGAGTLLIMDDEDYVRVSISHVLESFGYSVVCMADGREVIDYFSKEISADRKVAGMILDLTIPGGMGGKEAIGEIRALSSEVPVFVASGYSQDPIISNPVDYGFTASLAKPFTRAGLGEMLENHIAKGG